MLFSRHTRRRDFMTLFAGAATAWPLAASAQQPSMPVIGFLNGGSPGPFATYVAAFRQGLGETGYAEGRSVAIEFRWAEGQYDRLPALAADLVGRQVTVIAAMGTAAPGRAAKAATAEIPIVFLTGSDPVKDGLVTNMNRPAGNVTGISRLATTMGPKRLELLRELVPKATAIALLVNPTNPTAELQVGEMREPARSLGLDLHVLKASSERELDIAFVSLMQQGDGALVMANEPSFAAWRHQLVALAARHAVPVMYSDREYVAGGGLMSYAASLADSFRQVGVYVGKVLNGAKPADLPVMQPTNFELVINLKTAKVLGLTVPNTLLVAADEVIE
jgi:putative tryptophan/tyrosine transport system substrate-binding protein